MDSSEFHFSPRPNRAHEIGWRPWSEAAFKEARDLNRPILLSISAVWCHWCHVMDETTYSHPGVIDLIKSEYVPVRVDNDVRPDINQRYNMGGWPTTAFLTPHGDILTGATYMPADQMADALGRIASYFRTNQTEIATRVLEARKNAGLSVARSTGDLDASQVDSVLEAVTNAYDPIYGGFGGAPKFPHTDAILLLLEQSELRSDPELKRMAVHTLEQMSSRGTYDHVEGGFFRYSTTQDWSVPHFEKMLEDHAGLIEGLARAGMTEVLDKTTGYLDKVLRKDGLYAGSQDADEKYYSLDANGRAKLEAPYVDRRIYTGWNAALAVAYLDAAVRCNRPELREAAIGMLDRMFATRYSKGALEHAEGVRGQLGDHAWAMLAAARAGDHERAGEIAQYLEDHFADRERGGYFDRIAENELGRLTDRIKPLAENSLIAIALVELEMLEQARRTLESVAGLPRQYGLMAAVYARALDRVLRPAVKVTTLNHTLAQAAMLAHPYVVIERKGDDRAVICVGTMCLAPVTKAEAVTEAIHASA